MSSALQGTYAGNLETARAADRRHVWDLRDSASWDRLESPWSNLQKSAARLPMTDLTWCRTAAEAVKHPLAFTVGDGHEWSAAAAMEVVRLDGTLHLSLLSQDLLHEPMDLLYRDEASLVELLRLILKQGYPLYLGRLDAESKLAAALRNPKLPWHIQRVTSAPGCPMIHLDERCLEPESLMSSVRRQGFRRALRKAERTGTMRVEILSPEAAEVGELVEQAFEVEAASWKGDEQSALKVDAVRGNFFRRYAKRAAQEGLLRLAFLHLEGRPAAMQFCVEACGGLWTLKIGYDRRFSIYSPGQILTRELIAYAAKRKLKTFEFIGGIADWTEGWTKKHRECVCVQVYPLAMRSAAALTNKLIKVGLRKLHRPQA